MDPNEYLSKTTYKSWVTARHDCEYKLSTIIIMEAQFFKENKRKQEGERITIPFTKGDIVSFEENGLQLWNVDHLLNETK